MRNAPGFFSYVRLIPALSLLVLSLVPLTTHASSRCTLIDSASIPLGINEFSVAHRSLPSGYTVFQKGTSVSQGIYLYDPRAAGPRGFYPLILPSPGQSENIFLIDAGVNPQGTLSVIYDRVRSSLFGVSHELGIYSAPNAQFPLIGGNQTLFQGAVGDLVQAKISNLANAFMTLTIKETRNLNVAPYRQDRIHSCYLGVVFPWTPVDCSTGTQLLFDSQLHNNVEIRDSLVHLNSSLSGFVLDRLEVNSQYLLDWKQDSIPSGTSISIKTNLPTQTIFAGTAQPGVVMTVEKQQGASNATAYTHVLGSAGLRSRFAVATRPAPGFGLDSIHLDASFWNGIGPVLTWTDSYGSAYTSSQFSRSSMSIAEVVPGFRALAPGFGFSSISSHGSLVTGIVANGGNPRFELLASFVCS